ncbi:PaaI family thioesterase [Flexibacterium corallicola]|uniref:PaaI family thioesterase n=1 Tax=Flexibacterium corallicola TaxID=3037259 RepID=UPI00286F703F|nr:PaaI family thioesterase [Pseudovibrio sp. M1P-2-3]
MGRGIFQKMLDGEIAQPKAAQTLGARILEVDSKAGTITVEFDGKEEFTNPIGNIQGGFLAAMLDDTMGPALTATLGENEFAPTLELKTNFIAPALVGKLTGHGRVISKGRSVCVVEGELMQHGKLIARSSATALIRRIS